MTTVFKPVPLSTGPYADVDLWCNPAPQGLWSRVAVCTFWSPIVRARKTWNDQPAVIGTLRTLPGIDLLVRNLLANPQIRVVVLDGTDASADKATSKALYAFWVGEDYSVIGEDVPRDVLGFTREMNLTHMPLPSGYDLPDCVCAFGVDRSSPAIVLPPPPPKASAPAPHGDPGERVAGDTLADVWPLALQRIMAFGRAVPTQYGETRELLNLVSVIRDPAKSLEEIGTDGVQHMSDAPFANDVAHRILGLTYAQVADYARQFIDPVPPGGEGTSYAYGARLRGDAPPCDKACPNAKDGRHVHACRALDASTRPDQIAAVHKLLTDKPDTRAAFLTTWRPDEDGGKESGRPCLVGVTFRAVGGSPMSCTGCGTDAFYWKRFEDGGACPCGKGSWTGAGLPITPFGALHMTVTFRSHDMHGAYALNLAAMCLWLCEEAKSLGMAVGTLTCMSQSAHVYARDYNAANAKIEAHRWPPIAYDQRSTWRVEVASEACPTCSGTAYVDEPHMRCSEKDSQWCYDSAHQGTRDTGHCSVCGTEMPWTEQCKVRCECETGRVDSRIRAVCLSPDGNGITRVFTGKTATEIALQIERSGLITQTGNAIWLGGELAKAEGKL